MDRQYITQTTLEDLDIDLSGEDVDTLLEYLNDTVEERISTAITQLLTADQLKTLADMQESASEEALSAWLEENVPTMQDVAQKEIDTLLDEIVEEDDAAA